MDFLTPILPNIGRDPTRESLIELHRLISGNLAPVALNLRVGRHRHFNLTMIAEDYIAQTGYKFVTLHNPGDYPPTMGTAQEQALGTERFQQNESLFIRCTVVDRVLKMRSSRRYNQYSCTQWCTSWQGSYKWPCCKCSSIYLTPTGRSTKYTTRKTQ